jgi:hypothetical protein
MITIARAQNVMEVFEPGAPTDVDLFAAKQKYVYQIFERTLLTDEGKTIVRAHEDDYNAQEVYKKLVAHYKQSTKASLNAGDMLTYITSVRLDDGSWKGSSLGFVNHFLEQIRLYHQQVPSSERFSNKQVRTLLQNAITLADHFSMVKGQADLHKTKTGNYPDLSQYVELVKSATTTHDRRTTRTRPSLVTPKRCNVYSHDIVYDDGDDTYTANDLDTNYDINSPIETILANAAKTTPRQAPPPLGLQLPFDKWKILTPAQQQTWRSLPDDMKRVLLSSTSLTPSTSLSPPSKPGTIAQFANQHEQYNRDGDVGADELFHDALHLTNDGDDSAEADVGTHLAHSTKINDAHVGDLRRLMSTSSKRPPQASHKNKANPTKVNEVMIDGETFVHVNKHQVNTHIIYDVSAAHSIKAGASLVDRGANGGIAGDDVRLIPMGLSVDRKVNVRGVDNHELESIPLASVGGVTPTQHGPVIVIFHQYAYLARGKTIHSSRRLEHFHNQVDDKSMKVGGSQHIITLDGYVLPLDIKQGLAYLRLCPYTDDEWDSLPHVIMTSDTIGEPTFLDHTYDDDNDIWFDTIKPGSADFDAYGDYRHRTVTLHDITLDAPENTMDDFTHVDKIIETCVHFAHTNPQDAQVTFLSFEHFVQKTPPNYALLRKFFAYLPVDVIQRTFQHSTQYAKTSISTILTKHYKGLYPALNVRRRAEPVATDFVEADTPAIDDGSCAAQVYVGTNSMVLDVYGVKTSAQFVNTLEDVICHRGAMSLLISDSPCLLY